MKRKARQKNLKLLVAIGATGQPGHETATRAGLANSTLSALLNGRRDATPDTVSKLCAALHKTPIDLGFEGGVL